MVLKLSPQTKSIQSLYGQYRSDNIVIDRAYQRKLVWTLKEKQKLINSLLSDFPIPLILLAENKEYPNNQFILDGMQRLNAIFGFIENQFPLDTGEYFNIDEFPTAKDAFEMGAFQRATEDGINLDRAKCSKILDYSVPISIIQNASNEEIIEVFGRINSYGRQLSEQEQRQAGLRSSFSEVVREIACDLRGDTSPPTLPLSRMPSISIDPVSSQLGYGIDAKSVFWVQQRVLTSTGLRDSMDEHVIADTLACALLDGPVERSKEELDKIYTLNTDLAQKIEKKIAIKTMQHARDEYKFVISEIEKIVSASGRDHLRALLFKSGQTNPFPTVFAALYLALYELIINRKKVTTDYGTVAKNLFDISDKVKTGHSGRKSVERTKNINSILGIIEGSYTGQLLKADVYASPNSIDISNMLIASATENSLLEVKQGFMNLDGGNSINNEMIKALPEKICGIANNLEFKQGFLIIGVTDDENTVAKIKEMFGIDPIQMGKFFVCGIDHECKKLGTSLELHVNRLRDSISNSGLSDDVKGSALENMFCVNYKNKSIICIKINRSPIAEFVGDDCFVRDHNQTVSATSQQVASLAEKKADLKRHERT